MKRSKRMQPAIDYAKRRGFSVTMTRKGHLKFRKPGRVTVFTSSTPSDVRSVHNTIAMLRKADRGIPL